VTSGAGPGASTLSSFTQQPRSSGSSCVPVAGDGDSAFDPDGVYVRRYVPEIAKLPNTLIHSPWNAPADVLRNADVRLDDNYPAPVVDLKESRERALAAFRKSLK
jgi:hypothetical protein